MSIIILKTVKLETYSALRIKCAYLFGTFPHNTAFINIKQFVIKSAAKAECVREQGAEEDI